MLVSTGTVSPAPVVAEADEAVLLEALAEAGDALTSALVAHDLDALTAATHAAEALVARLDRGPRRLPTAPPGSGRDAATAGREPRAAIAARIAAVARRNALLLETAWATDAAVLRLLAAAATEQQAGPAYGAPAQGPLAAGWLDRSA